MRIALVLSVVLAMLIPVLPVNEATAQSDCTLIQSNRRTHFSIEPGEELCFEFVPIAQGEWVGVLDIYDYDYGWFYFAMMDPGGNLLAETTTDEPFGNYDAQLEVVVDQPGSTYEFLVASEAERSVEGYLWPVERKGFSPCLAYLSWTDGEVDYYDYEQEQTFTHPFDSMPHVFQLIDTQKINTNDSGRFSLLFTHHDNPNEVGMIVYVSENSEVLLLDAQHNVEVRTGGAYQSTPYGDTEACELFYTAGTSLARGDRDLFVSRNPDTDVSYMASQDGDAYVYQPDGSEIFVPAGQMVRIEGDVIDGPAAFSDFGYDNIDQMRERFAEGVDLDGNPLPDPDDLYSELDDAEARNALLRDAFDRGIIPERELDNLQGTVVPLDAPLVDMGPLQTFDLGDVWDFTIVMPADLAENLETPLLDYLYAQGFSEDQVAVTPIAFENYWVTLGSMVARGEPPDVMFVNRSMFVRDDEYIEDEGVLVHLAPEGLLMPLDDLLDRVGLSRGTYPPAVLEMYTFDGQLYGLPYMRYIDATGQASNGWGIFSYTENPDLAAMVALFLAAETSALLPNSE